MGTWLRWEAQRRQGVDDDAAFRDIADIALLDRRSGVRATDMFTIGHELDFWYGK